MSNINLRYLNVSTEVHGVHHMKINIVYFRTVFGKFVYSILRLCKM